MNVVNCVLNCGSLDSYRSLGGPSKASTGFFQDPRSGKGHAEALMPHGCRVLPARLRPLKQAWLWGAFSSRTRVGSSLGRQGFMGAREGDAQGVPAEANASITLYLATGQVHPFGRTSAIVPGVSTQGSQTGPWGKGRLVSRAGP